MAPWHSTNTLHTLHAHACHILSLPQLPPATLGHALKPLLTHIAYTQRAAHCNGFSHRSNCPAHCNWHWLHFFATRHLPPMTTTLPSAASSSLSKHLHTARADTPKSSDCSPAIYGICPGNALYIVYVLGITLVTAVACVFVLVLLHFYFLPRCPSLPFSASLLDDCRL